MAKDVRLQKMLADCGVASRRKAEEMIANGRVKVNGRVAKIGDKVDTKKDKITVDNKTVVSSVRSVYYMLHKPRGFITTMSDEMGRKCVAELVADIPERIYPVGRLDRDSELNQSFGLRNCAREAVKEETVLAVRLPSHNSSGRSFG